MKDPVTFSPHLSLLELYKAMSRRLAQWICSVFLAQWPGNKERKGLESQEAVWGSLASPTNKNKSQL